MFKRLRTKYLCKKYGIKNYTINKDGSIDVDGHVNLKCGSSCNGLELGPIHSSKILEKLPLRFNIVNGNFDCSFNKLSSFDGFPKKINGDLIIRGNKFTSLNGCPSIGYSKLDIGFEVVGRLDCRDNKIISFDGYRDDIWLWGKTPFLGNPINNMWNLFKDVKLIDLFNDYDIIRDENNPCVIKYRLDEFLKYIDVAQIEKHQYRIFKGYKLITIINGTKFGEIYELD